MRGIHTGKGHLGVAIDGGEDIAFLAAPVAYDGVDTEQESRNGLPLEFGDLLAGPAPGPFPIGPRNFGRFIVQARRLDDALDLPCGDRLIRIFGAIELEELHLAVAEVVAPQRDHFFVAEGGIRAESPAPGRPGPFFEAADEILFEPREPVIEGFAGDPEMAGGERHVLAVLLPEDDPFEAAACGTGEMLQFRDSAPAAVLVAEPVPAMGEAAGAVERPHPGLLAFLGLTLSGFHGV